jgi:hypothetical protein
MGKGIDPLEKARKEIRGHLEEVATEPNRDDGKTLIDACERIFCQKIVPDRDGVLWQIVVDACHQCGLTTKQLQKLREEIFA